MLQLLPLPTQLGKKPKFVYKIPMKKLSLIIPTYNEAQNLPVLLSRLEAVLEGTEKEVIVVDDDSPDQTWRVAKELTTRYPWLRVLRRLDEKGLSSAVLAGFAVAEGDLLGVMDADLQHDESILPGLIEALTSDQASIAIGSRKAEGGKIENWSFMRRFGSWVATRMTHFTLRQPVKDPMSGFFLITRKVYQNHKAQINPRGFKILLEFVVRAKNVAVVEIGYTFRGRIYGESKLSSGVIIDYLKALYDLSPFGALIPTRFVKYALVGASGLLVSYLALLLFYQGFGFARSWAVAAAIELSILTNYVLNNIWTFQDVQLKFPWAFLRGLATFQAICLSGALINQAMALWLNEPFGLNLYVANALGYVVAAIWNYVINVKVTWRTVS